MIPNCTDYLSQCFKTEGLMHSHAKNSCQRRKDKLSIEKQAGKWASHPQRWTETKRYSLWRWAVLWARGRDFKVWESLGRWAAGDRNMWASGRCMWWVHILWRENCTVCASVQSVPILNSAANFCIGILRKWLSPQPCVRTCLCGRQQHGALVKNVECEVSRTWV